MSRMSDDAGRVRMALAHVQQGVKGERNDLAMRGLAVLVQLGDHAALRQVEDCLSTEALYHYYGDRDDEPLPWEIDPAVFAALTRWWERLGLGEERAGWLVDDWLGETQHFGFNGRRFFQGAAPALAQWVTPRLLAALSGADAARRRRVADGLGYLPTRIAGQTLLALLEDPDETVCRGADLALRGLARQSDIADLLLVALRSSSPRARLGALEALDWFHGHEHRNQLTFPVLFERAMPLVVRLLTDPDPAIRRLAVERVIGAGYHLDLLRPTRAREWDRAIRLPDDLDLVPLLNADDDLTVRAGLYLAGRRAAPAEAVSRPAALARIAAVLGDRASVYLTVGAALQAAARLRALEVIPIIAPYMSDRTRGYTEDSALVLGQLGHAPARPYLDRIHREPFRREEAREVLAMLDAATGNPPAATR